MSSYKDAVPVLQADGTYALTYQVTDADGVPIGSKSVFTGGSESECYRKSMQAHQSAQQAIERLRKRQPVYKPGQEPPTVPQAIEQAALAEKQMIEAREAYRFMQNHLPGGDHPYFACQANGALLASWLEENDLEFVAENLEIAFDAVENSLAKTNKPVASETPEEIIPPVSKKLWDDIKTREDIKSMSRERYKELFFNPKHSVEFKKHITTILGGN